MGDGIFLQAGGHEYKLVYEAVGGLPRWHVYADGLLTGKLVWGLEGHVWRPSECPAIEELRIQPSTVMLRVFVALIHELYPTAYVVGRHIDLIG